MKKLLYLILMLPLFTLGQGKNHIRTTHYKKPSTSVSVDIDDPADASSQKTFFDGLGRPVQYIAYKQAGNGGNLLTRIEYDIFGNQVKDYLPIADIQTLNYRNISASYIESYYDQQVIPTMEATSIPYSYKKVEQSPLNRLEKQTAPGEAWALNSGHEIQVEYQVNIVYDSVKHFEVNSSWSTIYELYDISLANSSGLTYYNPSELRKTITKNENWVSGRNNTTEEFKDKNDRVILKRAYNDNKVHDTYYVYDRFGNLTYVMPPLADGAITDDILNGLCYQYKYDYKNRLVEKKLPGKEWEFIVYDKEDRIVMTGPTSPPFSNLSNNGWMFYKYDVFNRVIMTGWMTSAQNITSSIRKTRQGDRNLLTENFNESRLTGGNTTPAQGANPAYNYTNVSFPTGSYYVLTINYYDDYDYVNAPNPVPSSVEGQPVYYNNTIKPKGLLTGRWIKGIDKSTTTVNTRELTYILYDEKARSIRTFVRNHQGGGGGFTQTDVKYDFEGKVEQTTTFHKRINSETPGITVKDFYTYTDQGRMLAHTQQVNSTPIQLIAENTYDDLGNLISKKVGNTVNDPLQKVDYRYNIRGWLTKINDVVNLAQSGDPIDLFAFKIGYNDVQNNPVGEQPKALFNGNISETFWVTNTDNVVRRYLYMYDNLNRFNSALYFNGSIVKSFNEEVSYDKNGNIKSLFRTGDIESVSDYKVVDDLDYVYYADSNQLKKVTDIADTVVTTGFNDGADNLEEYECDKYGNMTRDDNKGITEIKYNHLNLPIKITFGTTGTIEYIYNSDGVKLEKKVTQGAVETTTKYLQGFQYVNDVLQFFPHAEGYVTKQGSSFKYVFQYIDHLGNVRLSYTKNETTGNSDIIEENHYYPFGLKHLGYNTTVLASGNMEAQKYKYNGKEFQDELDLNLYDYGARNYDPAIGRWMNIDPLAELAPNVTPFRYGFNNPLVFTDPTGMYEEEHNPAADPDYDDWIKLKNGGVRFYNDIDSKEKAEAKGLDYLGKNVTYKSPNNGMTYFLYPDGTYDFGKTESVNVDATNYSTPNSDHDEIAEDYFSNVEEQWFDFDDESDKGDLAELLAIPLVISQTDGLQPGPADLLALLTAMVIIDYYYGPTAMATTIGHYDAMSQRGNNNGRLQEDELAKILERKAAGTATSAELQKLKKHQKNTGERGSRQSKDKKR
jgi:RHS repeat-associated protein